MGMAVLTYSACPSSNDKQVFPWPSKIHKFLPPCSCSMLKIFIFVILATYLEMVKYTDIFIKTKQSMLVSLPRLFSLAAARSAPDLMEIALHQRLYTPLNDRLFVFKTLYQGKTHSATTLAPEHSWSQAEAFLLAYLSSSALACFLYFWCSCFYSFWSCNFCAFLECPWLSINT